MHDNSAVRCVVEGKHMQIQFMCHFEYKIMFTLLSMIIFHYCSNSLCIFLKKRLLLCIMWHSLILFPPPNLCLAHTLSAPPSFKSDSAAMLLISWWHLSVFISTHPNLPNKTMLMIIMFADDKSCLFVSFAVNKILKMHTTNYSFNQAAFARYHELGSLYANYLC